MDKLTQEQRKRLYLRLLLRTVLFVAGVLFIIFAVPVFFSLFAPFIFAFLVAIVLNPLVNKLNSKFGFPRKLAALILVILVFSVFASLIGRFLYTVVNEAVLLAKNFQSVSDSITSASSFINIKLEWLLDFLPSDTEAALNNIMNSVYEWLRTASRNFLNVVFSRTASATTKFSGGVVGVVIFIIAAYFITAEYQTIGSLAKKHLSSRMYIHFSILKDALQSAFGGYLKAQFLLALLAFVVMFTALAIYGQDYVFLIALFLAFIDFIPILGTAAVLVPWAALELVGGDIFKGIFLIVLSGAFFVLRKMVEPKIVGSQIGLHPLVALMSIFVGLKVTGIWGAILGPIVVMAAINVVKAHVFDNTIRDVKDVIDDLAGFLRRED